MVLKRFVLNEHLDVVLEADGNTYIYFDDKPFLLCKHLVMTLPANFPGGSMDEIVQNVPVTAMTEIIDQPEKVATEEIFWGHCSNLQAWIEHGYDTRLLDSRLSFPLLRVLSRAGDDKARRALQAEAADRLASGSPSVAVAIVEACFGNGDVLIDPEELVYVLPKDLVVRLALARCNATPAAVLDKLARDESELSWTIPPTGLPPYSMPIQYSHDIRTEIRAQVAKHPNVEAATLEFLGSNDDRQVRDQVAENPNATAALLERMLAEHPENAWAIGKNKAVPARLLERMGRNDDFSVRYCAVVNKSTPPSILDALIDDPDEKMKSISFSFYTVQSKLAWSKKDRIYVLVPSYVSGNSRITSSTILLLASSIRERRRSWSSGMGRGL
jgi:hypothetical protein